MLVRADGMAGCVETPIPLGTDYPGVPAAAVFLQYSEQRDVVATTVAVFFRRQSGAGVSALVCSSGSRQLCTNRKCCLRTGCAWKTAAWYCSRISCNLRCGCWRFWVTESNGGANGCVCARMERWCVGGEGKRSGRGRATLPKRSARRYKRFMVATYSTPLAAAAVALIGWPNSQNSAASFPACRENIKSSASSAEVNFPIRCQG